MNLHNTLKAIALSIGAMVFTFQTFAQCGLSIPTPLQTRVSWSELVIEGKVLNSQPFYNNAQTKIYTRHTVEVYKVFKDDNQAVDVLAGANSSQFIQIVTEGGLIGNEYQEAHPNLNLDKNNYGVFLLKKRIVPSQNGWSTSKYVTTNEYVSVAVAQGFIRYNIHQKTASDVYNQYQNIDTDVYATLENIIGTTKKQVAHFNIMDVGNPDPIPPGQFRATPAITSFTPTTASAGTFDTITITGTDFGTYVSGTSAVGFFSADDGGATYFYPGTPEVYIVSWSSTTIVALVPTDAGTGNIIVRDGTSTESAFSASTLTVPYQMNQLIASGPVLRGLRGINDNGVDGYDWKFSTGTANNGVNFYTDDSAKARMMDAMYNIRCSGFYNFDSLGTTSTQTDGNDGENVIMYDDDVNTLGGATLGTGYSQFSNCGGDTWYISGVDIRMRRDGTGGTTWYYGADEGSQGGGESDFESVCLHELLHTCGVGHEINPGAVMHYSITTGTNNRSMSANDANATGYTLEFSSGFASCSQTGLDSFDCAVPPVAGFTVDNQGGCSAPLVCTFTDQSTSGPTGWSWDFGDGSTSTSQNPMHTYTACGLFDVTLIASNANGSDTLKQTQYIVLGDATPASACAVPTGDLSTNYGTGIHNFTLGTIDNSTSGAFGDTSSGLTTDGYIDYACSKITVLYRNTSYTWSVDVGSSNPEFVDIYIDYNDDGDFSDAGENVVNDGSSTNNHSGSFVTSATCDLSKILRMRVLSDFSNPTGSCDAPTYGQVEDYGVMFTDSNYQDTLYWTGKHDTAWTLANNWTPFFCPDDSNIVCIPDSSGTDYDPVIGSGVNAAVKHLIIQDSHVEVTGTGTITISAD